MKALVKAKPERGIWMMDQPLPVMGVDDVLIKIKKTAICGTDIHIYNWDEWAQENVPVPLITGHEFMGEIVDLGSNVSRHKVGMRVSGEGHIVGDRSRAAREGKWHLSPDTKGVGVNRPAHLRNFWPFRPLMWCRCQIMSVMMWRLFLIPLAMPPMRH